MGLCKCPRRKVTNLFCFEHDVNVCEYCLVADHERCIVQSYVQWLQDSDYSPICILCNKMLQDEQTVRLACYDVFHWSCIDKYASELPANTAPAGYQCPKCKEGIFPPPNLVSPVVDALKKKLETVSWSRVGLGQSLLQIDESSILSADEAADLKSESPFSQIEAQQSASSITNANPANNNTTDDESNGFVIINKNKQQQQQQKLKTSENTNESTSTTSSKVKTTNNESANSPKTKNQLPPIHLSNQLDKTAKTNFSNNQNQMATMSNRTNTFQNQHLNSNQESSQMYDPSLGVVLNVDTLEDRDTGEMKYKRRPLFEWLARWLKSRQMANRRLFRMTRQKKILFVIIFIFIGLFTLIVIFSRLGSLSTENDPALDPMNNPNIRVE